MAKKLLLNGIAWFGDFLLALACHQALSNISSYRQFMERFRITGGESWTELVPSFIALLICFLILRILAQLVLNRSLMVAFLGLKMQRGGPAGRLAGSSYHFFSLFLLPLNVICDLFSMINPAEYLSGTGLEKPFKVNPIRVYFAFFILLLLSISALFAPLYYERMKFNEESIIFENQLAASVLDFENIDQDDQVAASKRFHFLIKKQTLNNKNYIFLPGFGYQQIGSKRKIIPQLRIIDRLNNVSYSLKMKGKIDLAMIMNKAKESNPFFSLSYPKISTWLIEDPPKQMSWAALASQLYGEMDPLLKQEMEQLVDTSFNLQAANYLGHLLTEGPFVGGFLNLKEIILSLGGATHYRYANKVLLSDIGNYRFLQLTSAHELRQSWIPLGTSFPLLYELDVEHLEGEEQFIDLESLKEAFFKKLLWTFDYHDFYNYNLNEKRMSILNIIDQLTAKNLKKRQVELLENFIFRYYFDLAQRLLKERESDAIISVLVINIERIKKVVELKNAQDKKFSALFISRLRDLRQSLEIKDLRYFKLETKAEY